MSQRNNKITLLEKTNSGVNFGGQATYTMFDALTSANEPIVIGLTENYLAESRVDDLLDSIEGCVVEIKDSYNRDNTLQLTAAERIEEVILNVDGKRNFLLTSKANVKALVKSQSLLERQDNLIALTNAKVKIENQREKAIKAAHAALERIKARAVTKAIKSDDDDDDDEEQQESVASLETNNDIETSLPRKKK